jgi:TRAP-type mannitol/chloroaromatic compound transport system substrate-binding protein
VTISNDAPSRRSLLAGAALGGLGLTLPMAPAIASERFRWRLVTSWPKGAPGPGTTADRLAAAITALSQGRLTVEVYGTGELVPAFEVFDAVAAGTAQMGHSASFFWSGKMAAAPFFTAVPFGLTPEAHNAWITYGGGQALWDELYDGFGIKPFLAGNSGFQMGGWYNREIDGLDDFKGLKIRMPGLGGEVVRRLGATPVSLPPGEIHGALRGGVIDAAEFLGPWSDSALGLNQAARFYYWPGFHEPNGSAECLVNREALETLPKDLRQLVNIVCAAENQRGLSEAEWFNALTLSKIEQDQSVALRRFPPEVLNAARETATEVLTEVAAKNDIAGRIYESYDAARTAAIGWGRVSRHALLEAQLNGA